MSTHRLSPLALWLVVMLLQACTAVRMHQADNAYDLMHYPKAERLYEKALARRDDRPARIRLADSYRKHNAYEQARVHYARLDSARPLTGDTALAYAEVLMGLGEREVASDLYFRVLQEAPEDRRALDRYESAQGFASFYADTGRYIVTRLTLPGIATAFAPIPYQGGLIVAGERAMDDKQANPWNERSFLDLYHTTSRTIVTWSEARPLPGSVNGTYHEGPAALSADGRTLYFTRSNYVERKLLKDERNTSHLKLFRATLDSTGKWTDLRAFAYNGENWSTGHPALSKDGRTLYFASDRPGGSGGMDLWRCRDNGTGWSEPENLGQNVNTPGNELFPTINGDALHFSSTGHFNMGGLDILETREQDGQWSQPRNLLYPVNTVHDDMHFVLDSTGLAGYLSSDRSGIDQVHAFTVYEPLFYLDGITLDQDGTFLPNTSVVLTDLGSGEDVSLFTDANGRFRTDLKPNSEYSVKCEREGMLTSTNTISTKGLIRSDTLSLEMRMTPVQVGQAIAINNIYYDYDKWDIRPEAAQELDKLVKIFHDNPKLVFELGSHTDSRGGDIYNLVLSDARAQAAVNYLIRNGVSPDQISAKGYGEGILVNSCRNGVRCTEEAHQDNRRTEFKLTGSLDLASNPRH
jgi:peptidoglycan-associated lipoprotein